MTTNYKPKHASQFAWDAHRGQTRRDGVTSHYQHLVEVAKRFRYGSMTWQAAYLHDVLEDTTKTQADLYNFGVPFNVVQIVLIVTKEKHECYEEFIDRIIQSGNANAMRVKFADIISNLSDNPTARQVEKYGKALIQLSSVIDYMKINGKLFDR